METTLVTGKTREEQLREWQASQGRGKLSEKQGTHEASKENIPQQGEGPRSRSTKKGLGPREIMSHVMESLPQVEEGGEDGAADSKPSALDSFKSKYEEFGRRQSARANAPCSRIPLPPAVGAAIPEDEEFEGSSRSCISKEHVFELTAATFDEEAFMVDCEKAFNYKFTTGRYDFKNREAEQDNLLKLLRRCLRTSFSKKDTLVKSLGSLADQAQQQLEGARLSLASAEAARDAAVVDHNVTSAALSRAREESARQQTHYESVVSQLEASLDSKTKEAQRSQERSTEQIAQLREELAKVRQQMADKNDAFDKLSEKEECAQDSIRQLTASVEDGLRQLATLKSQSQAEIAALEAAMAKAESDAALEHAKQTMALEHAASELAAEEAAHKGDVATLQEASAKLEAELMSTRSALGEERAAREATVRELTEQINATNASLAAEQDSRKTAEATGMELRGERDSLKVHGEKLATRVQDLEAEQEVLKANLGGVLESKAALELENSGLKKELAEQKETHAQTVQKNSSEREERALEIGRLEGERAHLKEEMVNLRDEVTSLRVKTEDLVQAKSTLQHEEAALKAKVAELAAQHETAAQEAESTIESLKQSKEKLRAESAETIEGLKQAAGSAAEKRREAETQLLAMIAQLESEKQEVDKLREELKEADARMKAQAAAIAAEKEDAAKRSALLQGDLEAFMESAGDGNSADAQMVVRLRDAMSELRTLRNELQDFNAIRAALNAEKERTKDLELELQNGDDIRRKLHNTIQELRGNVRVFCRVRPMPERAGEDAAATYCMPDGTSVRLTTDDAANKHQTFTYDKVFSPSAQQGEIFEEVSQLVQSALDGYKVCLFSYGQTGAGKTHTMLGCGTGEQRGIIPRAVEKVLEQSETLQEKGWEFAMEASYLEIYNEKLRDLLAPGSAHSEAHNIQHVGGVTNVTGLQREGVDSVEAARGLVRRAAAARAVEATAMNEQSSRSHTVFMLYITATHAASGTMLKGALNLVDLAGSERLSRSEATGDRARETCNINKSLSCLGDVFAALSKKQSHVPYRNSKLTYLLQPCLGGDGKTLMFVNINPEPASMGETLCSLRFAGQVNACELGGRGGASGAKRNVTSISSETEGSSRPATAPASSVLRGVAPRSSAPTKVPAASKAGSVVQKRKPVNGDASDRLKARKI